MVPINFSSNVSTLYLKFPPISCHSFQNKNKNIFKNKIAKKYVNIEYENDLQENFICKDNSTDRIT